MPPTDDLKKQILLKLDSITDKRQLIRIHRMLEELDKKTQQPSHSESPTVKNSEKSSLRSLIDLEKLPTDPKDEENLRMLVEKALSIIDGLEE